LLKTKDKSLVVKQETFVGEFLLVILMIVLSILLPVLSKAQKAKDGTISLSPGSSATYIVNRYSALASSAAAGANSVTVSSITDLSGSTSFTNSYNSFNTAALTAGDLVLVIQVQGASITTTDNSSYGNITAYNNVGNYELKVVSGISANTISFCDPLTYAYSTGGAKRAQVVRVPRYNTATFGSNAIISAKAWDGTSGGICAIETDGNLVVNGTLRANGTGFRGGTDPDINNSSTAGGTAVTLYRTSGTTAAGKGEGIAGNPTDYASMNGANGRGAPANGGGGGNGHNSGGGGGANAGNNGVLTNWNGTGVKPSGYNNAWNLESTNFATDVSRGGGRGGYSYGANDRNALTTGPGNTNWDGDYRQNVGGFGGRPLDYNSNARVFFGGGGGSGDGNNGHTGAGGNGGGIVIAMVNGNISGSGTITANANNGYDATGSDDGPGGGGGGGAIIAFASGTITGISMSANGGSGGNQPSGGGDESEGPGGGGGGGYIYTSSTSITRNVNGGNNGITNSTALTEFPPNGATKGDAGTSVNTGTFSELNGCFKQINGLNSPSCTRSSGSVAASNTIINTYYPATASVTSGAIKISVGTKRGSSAAISPGDLLLVIQMQGATINSSNSDAYGDGVSGGDASGYLTTVAGTYEFVYAASGVVNNTIYLTTPLKNAYTNSDYATNGQYRFQVVRVPEYSSLNIANSASITNAEWDGSSGGIIAANVAGTMTLNGGVAINASALGFRGGGGRELYGGTGSLSDMRTLSSANLNGSKGEGIAGTPRYTRSLADVLVDNGVEGYPNGSSAQGAPGNAGGGGTDGDPTYNDENTGGGGGGNGGTGGRGGRGWNASSQYGGYGGSTFAQAAASRLVLGGGGGAGSTNNGTAGGQGQSVSYQSGFYSSGGSGGGMIFLKVGAVSGSGTINANGANGLSVENDGGGGGGAGGSVYLYATNTAGLANVTINAKGGNGGSAWASQPNNGTDNDGDPEHGPGGGGGGGVIYTNGTINAASSVAGGAPGITTTSNLPYGATTGATGIKIVSTSSFITAVRVYCDIDDDDDGIADIAENPSSTVDPFDDDDNDGYPNVYDRSSGTSVAWADTNNDGINDYYDKDKDGIINELDLDSDNDGVPDVVEAGGVDANGDGVIDNFTDANNDGLSDNAATNSATLGLGLNDFDGDGIANIFDLDMDGDGIPDIIESGGTDSNNDGLIDNTTDVDEDGLADIVDGDVGNDGVAENSSNALLRTGADTDGDGKPETYPYKNADLTGFPNLADLDSDGDGILDVVEAGFSGTNGKASGADANGDGWSDTIDALTSLGLINTDGRGPANYLDIDSDDDGITDNVEAQSTSSYKIPNDTDSDGDGIADIYETAAQIGVYGGGGLTPYDFDGDGKPDYKDTDTDNDGVLDYIEGTGSSLYGVSSSLLNYTDSDGDGLVDQFDNVDITTLTAGNYYKNVAHNEMGTGGNRNGPTPSGSTAQLPQQTWNTNTDRDWRSSTILPLSIISFTVRYNTPIATLDWVVTNELNVGHYTVEVSTNGIDYTDAGIVNALNNGTANYQFPYHITDFTKSVYYFRIRQTDKDSKQYRTKVITVLLSKVSGTVVHPNPFTTYLQVDYTSDVQQRINLGVYTADGKQMYRQETAVMKGSNRLLLDNSSIGNLPPGIYYLHIISSNNQQEIIKLIKTK